MGDRPDKTEALDWVLLKLSAARKTGLSTPSFLPAQPASPAKFENPVLKQARLTAKRSQEEALARQLQGMRPGSKQYGETFDQLYTSLAPIVTSKVNQWAGAEVSKHSLRQDARVKIQKQISTWDPEKASLRTWVTSGLRGLRRTAVKTQNVARVPEHLTQKITPYRALVAELREKLGRAPSIQEIVDGSKGGFSKKDVIRMRTEFRRGYDAEGGGEVVEGAGMIFNDRHLMAAPIIYHDLTPAQQRVHEFLFPPSDDIRPVFSTGEIAKRLGWHETKVSKARTIILNRLNSYLEKA